MFNAKQFRSLIVKPTLETIGHWSKDDENLLIMLMAWESKGGTYLKQEGGPALGPYGMEPVTHDDLWQYVLHQDYEKEGSWKTIWDKFGDYEAEDMIWNLKHATAMARLFFLRIKEPIPTDLHELAAYAKKYWNTEKGKATPQEYYDAYCHFEGIKP